MASFRVLILPSALLATFAFARTDLTGCTSTDVSSPAGASVAWYVPGTGEMCDFLDCGGGMAPPATNVPGCPLYSGTSTYSPSFMPGYGSATAAASSSWSQASQTASGSVASGSVTSGSASASWSAWESNTASSSWDLYTTAAIPASSAWASGSSAWSSRAADNTASPLICAIGSCSPASTSTYTWSTSTTTIVQTPSAATAAGVASNGTMAGSTGSIGVAGNGTAPSATASPSSTVSTGGAVETAKAWMGAGVIVGLGAVVAAL